MENIQGQRPKTIRQSTNLSGPLTWILLVFLLVTFIGSLIVMFTPSPATALRHFFTMCFEGKYEQAWAMIADKSDYMNMKKDLKNFTDAWERNKTHGTEYLNVRIDGVVWRQNTAPSTREAKILYTIMEWDEQTREKETGNPEAGQLKIKVLMDSYMGSMIVENKDGGGWKISKAER